MQHKGDPNPVAEQVMMLAANICMGALFMTPMVLIAFFTNVYAFYMLGIQLTGLWHIDQNNVWHTVFFVMSVVGVIGLSTNRLGWWHTHERVGNTVSEKARYTYKLRLYGLMTVALTLIFAISLLTNTI